MPGNRWSVMSSEGLRRGHQARGRPRPTGFQAEALPQHHQHIPGSSLPARPSGPHPSLPSPTAASLCSAAPAPAQRSAGSALLLDAWAGPGPLISSGGATVLTIECPERYGVWEGCSGPSAVSTRPLALATPTTAPTSRPPCRSLGEHHLPIEASEPCRLSRSSHLEAAPTAQGSVQVQDGLQQCLCPAQCGLCAVQQLSSPHSGPCGLWTQYPISPQPLPAGGCGERPWAWEWPWA